jgi:23S rRNA pseudouridine1911/1915/1917 synthase
MPEEKEIYVQFTFNVDKNQSALRIDLFLVDRIEGVSRSKIKAAIGEGQIIVNGQTIKANYKVRPSDVVEVMTFTEPVNHELLPEDIPINIVYEDDQIIVVNKTPNMVVHPGVGNYTGTLVNALLHHFQSVNKDMTSRPLLAHRIDKDTSGILVIAKNEKALAFISKQFAKRTSKRTYKAIVWGSFEESEGTITGNIIRNPNDRKKYMVTQDEEVGKAATTHYKVMEDFTYVSLVECKLETGRTHQIRVHMKYSGHTVFSDSFYGGNRILKGVVFSKYKQFIENCFKALPRQALHAESLGFIHPTTKEEMFFKSELPDDFQFVLDKWRRISEAYDFAD